MTTDLKQWSADLQKRLIADGQDADDHLRNLPVSAASRQAAAMKESGK
jgi:hypothetical protein